MTQADLATLDAILTQRVRAGSLRERRTDHDRLVPTRTIERLQTYHGEVPVWGAEIVRESQDGIPVAIFGEIVPTLTLDTTPRLNVAEAERHFRFLAGDDATMLGTPQLTVLRLPTEEARLAYTAVLGGQGNVVRFFIDANDGSELLRYSELRNQAAIGTGNGVLGDVKKISVTKDGGTYLAEDQLRPPLLTTYDLRGDLALARAVLETGWPLSRSNVATDQDNIWTDPAIVDAHVHVGWTYDFLFKRFGRRGLDDHDRRITILTNGLSQEAAASANGFQLSNYATRAAWCGPCGGTGTIYFGNGIPATMVDTATGKNVTYLAGALDIAAHELAHGVIDASSNLIATGESGALDEAFADIIGTSTEFFFQPPGTGLRQADYVIGEDVFRARVAGARDGLRSLENPSLFQDSSIRKNEGNPDHYSRLFVDPFTTSPNHYNSHIVSHAFYLAIEGGTNRTSGVSVAGVGAANRAQIEKVFYRAFVYLLPASASFSIARGATIQAARDLYGVDSAAERALTQAWTAVGVQGVGTCGYGVTPPALLNTVSGGGESTFAVTTSPGCPWAASSNSLWMAIKSGATGTGSGTVTVTIQKNLGPARSGQLLIAGQTIPVSQDYYLCGVGTVPSRVSFGAAGGSVVVTLHAAADCAWRTNFFGPSFVRLSSISGVGSTPMTVTVAPNTTGAYREERIAFYSVNDPSGGIQGPMLFVTQDAK